MMEPCVDKHQEASPSFRESAGLAGTSGTQINAMVKVNPKQRFLDSMAAKVTPVGMFQKVALAFVGIRHPQVILQGLLHRRNYNHCIFHLLSSSRKQKSKTKKPVIPPDTVCLDALLAVEHIIG